MSNVDISALTNLLNKNLSSDNIVFTDKGTAYVSNKGSDNNDGYSPWTPKASLQAAIALNTGRIEIMDDGIYPIGGAVTASIIGKAASLSFTSMVTQLNGEIDVYGITTNGFQIVGETAVNVTAFVITATETPLVNCLGSGAVTVKCNRLGGDYGLYSGIVSVSQITNPPSFEVKSLVNVGQVDSDLILDGKSIDFKKHTYLGYVVANDLIKSSQYKFTDVTATGATKPASSSVTSLPELLTKPRTSITLNNSSPWKNTSGKLAVAYIQGNAGNAGGGTFFVDGQPQSYDATYGSSNGHVWGRLVLVKPGATLSTSGPFAVQSASVAYIDSEAVNEVMLFADTGVN